MIRDPNLVSVWQKRIMTQGKQKTCTSQTLWSCGKQPGNEEAWICDLSIPQQARTAVQFIGVLKSNKKIGLPLNSVVF